MHGGNRRVPHFVLLGNRYKQRKRKLRASAKKKKEKALAATQSSTSSLCVLCSDVCLMRPESCGNLYNNKTAAEAKEKQQQFHNARCAVATFHHGQQKQKVVCNGVVCLVSLASHTVGGTAFCLLFAPIKRKENSHTHTHAVRNMRDKVMSMQLVNVLVI